MQTVHHFLSLPSEMHTELSELAAQRGLSFSDLVLEVLAECLEVKLSAERKTAPEPSWSEKVGMRFAA